MYGRVNIMGEDFGEASWNGGVELMASTDKAIGNQVPMQESCTYRDCTAKYTAGTLYVPPVYCVLNP
jgi:hypothetical protein